jgi:hypothetical protein
MRSSWGVNLPPLLHITTTHHMQTQTLSTWLSLAFVAALTTGCGGGGSDAAPAAAATSPTPSTLATPTPTASTPATAAIAGILPFLAIAETGASSTQNVAITGSGTTSVMTFTSPAFTLTGADGGSATFSANGGQVKARGNVVSYCAAGKQAVAGTSDANGVAANGHRLFISANLTQVFTPTDLKGLTFSNFNCTGQVDTFAFSATGDTVAHTNPTGSTESELTAGWTASLSDAGETRPNGNIRKTRIYKYTAAGVSKYFLVFIVKLAGVSSPLAYQVNIFSQD